MIRKPIRALILLAAMAGSSYAAVLLTPQVIAAHDQHSRVGLEEMIPKQFGEWRTLDNSAQGVISADLQAELDKYYSELLSRVYVNDRGDRIMLSLAYGADQSKSLQVHKPEICYAAQGFKILDKQDATVAVTGGDVPATRLDTRMGNRREPITYWIRFGDEIVRNWFEQNRARILTGLKGHVPDGLLVRVSTIESDTAQAYRTQDKFLKDLLATVGPEGRRMLIGVKPLDQRSSN
ncbi:MAG TPA: EpsI family protein [Candidatus Aquabacterium excrementipullorum]|nr:EpsI family protein [Candidatus Aquabacterium excrementipullorum]